MTQDPLTLYKLIILYMLNRVTFPLTKSQIGDFILEKEYTNFLTLQQVISELIETNLIYAKTFLNRTHLQITESGIETLNFFENRVNDEVKQDIKEYLFTNEYKLQDEVSIQTDYYKSTSGEYEANLIAKEKSIELIHIKLSVPTKEIARSICENWEKKNEEIYNYLVETLF